MYVTVLYSYKKHCRIVRFRNENTMMHALDGLFLLLSTIMLHALISSFSTLRIFYTLHFLHSPFSTLPIFYTPIFHTPHFLHSALLVFHLTHFSCFSLFVYFLPLPPLGSVCRLYFTFAKYKAHEERSMINDPL